jgi:hypothetical protein
MELYLRNPIKLLNILSNEKSKFHGILAIICLISVSSMLYDPFHKMHKINHFMMDEKLTN